MNGKLNNINKLELLGLLCVLLLTAVVYLPGLNGPLLLDDYPKLGIFFSSTELSNSGLYEQTINNFAEFKRPVSMLSFGLNYIYAGDNLIAWKSTNLIIHLLCGLIWFCFFKIIERILSLRSGTNCKYLALTVATIWLLHPLQVSTTLYLVQRMAQLSALFIGLGLLSYAYGRLKEIQGQSGRMYLWLSIILFLPLAILSKQNGILLLLFILVTELFICKFSWSPLLKKEASTFLLAGMLLPIACGLVILAMYFNTIVLEGFQGRPFSMAERLLTEFRVVCMYLGQVVWPSPSSMYFFYENLPVSESLFKPVSTVASFIVILLLLTGAWMVRAKIPLFSFGIFFYFVSISIESTIFPLELAFEHRNYIGLVGLSAAGYALLTNLLPGKIPRYLAYLAIIAVLGMTAATRAQTWSSKTNLYNEYYKLNPESPRIVSMMAEELTKQERYDQALNLLTRVDASGAILQSLYVRCVRGDDLSQINYRDLADKIASPLNNYTVTGVIELSNLGLDKKCELSLEYYQAFLSEISSRVFRDKNDKFKVLMYQAHYLWELDRREAAFDLLESLAYEADTNPIPLYLAAEWALDMGNRESAIRYLQQAEQISDSNIKDYSYFRDSIVQRLGTAN
ncbi:MAG: hypothetical protein U5P41_03980 [Gammaproteobacteria bacterium]|nr:hypothetical protein [Gammaproteobacteria bacterium]